MERDDPIPEWEAPGARWQRFAATHRERLQPANAWVAAARTLEARRNLAPSSLDEVRRRIRQATGRIPLRHSDLKAPALPPDDDVPRVERTSPVLLDPLLQQHLERFLRFRLPRIQIHTTPVADRIARRVGADAVTARDSIYFRHGAFRPDTPAGMGLLAHEATHVAWGHGARPALPAGPGPIAQEEPTALTNERRYLARRESVPLVAPSAATRTNTAAPASAPPAFVQTAMASRDVDDQGSAPPPQGAQLSDAALRMLKGDLYRSLLDKLRSEFERGA